MAGRKGEYLFKRNGSANWHIRFVYPVKEGQDWPKRIEFSLETPNRLEAEIAAAEHIKNHKILLHTMRAIHGGAVQRRFGHRYEPGREHHAEDGSRIVATANQLIFLNAHGEVAKIEANTASETIAVTVSKSAAIEMGIVSRSKPEKKLAGSLGDIAHLERWIRHKAINGYLEREARTAWALFRDLTNNKPLAECDRDDGRKLVAHLFDSGNKSATVRKKVGHLCAAVNLAMSEDKLRFNPFSSIVPKTKDETRRVPLDDHDMKLIWDGRHTFDQREWLLYMLCATTGMRRSEAYEIEAEKTEAGIRYVRVGEKTEQSERRVPLSEAVLLLLPKCIVGKIFSPEITDKSERERDRKNLGREVLRQMRRLGITNPEKTFHSTRHRAKDRLRAAGCPLDIQYEILGHEEKTVAAGYGHGYPVRVLKEWIECIGY